jgi:predicted MFS family arabinose efflux permease
MGTYNFSGDMGKVCIPFLLTVMINLWGWRQAVFILSIGGLATGTILWILTRQNKDSLGIAQPKEASKRESGGWGIRNRKSFSALLTVGIIDIMARNALFTFLPFLFLRKGIPVTKVGFALTLLFVGGAIGKFACGVLAEWFGVIPMVVGTEVLTIAGILCLTWSPTSVIWMILPFVGIVLNGTSSVLYATVAEIISPETRSRGYGLYYAITLGSGAISPVVYGLFIDYLGLSFAITSTALMVLLTIPLSRYLKADRG